MFEYSDLEFIWFLLKSLIFEAINLFVPKIFVRDSQDPKWFNSEIQHLLKCLCSMRRKFKAYPSQYREDKIKDFEVLLQHKREEAKSAYESKLIKSLQSHGSPAIYSYIRSLSTHKAFPSVMNLNTKCAVTDEEKAYLFNEFFHSMFTVSPFLLLPVRDFK